jgi:hypothetical protein
MKKILIVMALLSGVGIALAQKQPTPPTPEQGNLRAASSQPTVSTRIVPGSKVYIEKMNGFEAYLAAAFSKKKVQLVPVADEEQADYIISGHCCPVNLHVAGCK